MKFHIFNLVIEINISTRKHSNHPDYYSDSRRRTVAKWIDRNLPYVAIGTSNPKIARVKAIRKIGLDAGYNMDTELEWGLKTAKEWVERTYANYGRGKVL